MASSSPQLPENDDATRRMAWIECDGRYRCSQALAAVPVNANYSAVRVPPGRTTASSDPMPRDVFLTQDLVSGAAYYLSLSCSR